MEVDRPSSPLSAPEDYHDTVSGISATHPATNGIPIEDGLGGRPRSKFSVAALCSPSNSTSVHSSLTSTPADATPQTKSPHSDGLRLNGDNPTVGAPTSQISPSASSSPKKRSDNDRDNHAVESEAGQDGADGDTSVVGASEEGSRDAEEADDDDEEEGDGDDDEEEEEDDDEEEEDDGDEEDDEDDDDDDNSTGSRDLDADVDDGKPGVAADGNAAATGDVSMADADGDRSLPPVKSSDASTLSDGASTTPSGASTAAAAARPTKQIKRKEREPSVDVSLPKAPPTLPTIRLPLKVTKSSYMFEVPKLLHAELKAKHHPWAAWWEQREAAGLPGSSTGTRLGSSHPVTAVPDALGDLGAYAHLLNRYPVDAVPVAGEKKRKKRRKRHELEDYDVNDPFVDDSELPMDEPTHSAKPLSKGFYIVAGDVELETLAKKRRKVGLAATNGQATASPQGTQGSNGANAAPTASGIRSDGIVPARPHYLAAGTQLEVSNMLHHLRVEERGLPIIPSMPPSELPATALGLVGTETIAPDAGSRTSPIEVKDEGGPAGGSNKKKLYPVKPVDKRLAAELEYLVRLVAAESFQVKSKFPPNLRQPLRKAAKIALDLGQYNENFFNYLPNIFPYNRFTMSKLIKRDFFEDHLNVLKELQDDVLSDLKEAIEEALPAHRAEYEEQSRLWQIKTGGQPTSSNGAGAGDDLLGSQTAPINLSDGESSSAPPVEDTSAGAASNSGPEPLRKWKWTERMKEDVFRIIVIENGMTELKMEKCKLEGSLELVSELNQRKAAYKRISELWPRDEEGLWTSTTAISTQFSLHKKKHERQNLAIAEQQQQQ